MRSLSEIVKKDIIKYVNDYYFEYYRSPGICQIAAGLEISKSAISKYIHKMADDGIIIYKDNQIITDKIAKVRQEIAMIPLLGNVPCGIPFSCEENIEKYYFFPIELINERNVFFLKASGDSMIDAGIENGDYVLVKRCNEPKDGDIIVALIDDEVTLKKYFYDSENNRIILHPENKSMNDIYVKSCEIQGKAIKVLKNI